MLTGVKIHSTIWFRTIWPYVIMNVEVQYGSDFNGHQKIETVCTNNTVGYRPISSHGLMTRVATGLKFGMKFFFGGGGCVSVRSDVCVIMIW